MKNLPFYYFHTSSLIKIQCITTQVVRFWRAQVIPQSAISQIENFAVLIGIGVIYTVLLKMLRNKLYTFCLWSGLPGFSLWIGGNPIESGELERMNQCDLPTIHGKVHSNTVTLGEWLTTFQSRSYHGTSKWNRYTTGTGYLDIFHRNCIEYKNKTHNAQNCIMFSTALFWEDLECT